MFRVMRMSAAACIVLGSSTGPAISHDPDPGCLCIGGFVRSILGGGGRYLEIDASKIDGQNFNQLVIKTKGGGGIIFDRGIFYTVQPDQWNYFDQENIIDFENMYKKYEKENIKLHALKNLLNNEGLFINPELKKLLKIGEGANLLNFE